MILNIKRTYLVLPLEDPVIRVLLSSRKIVESSKILWNFSSFSPFVIMLSCKNDLLNNVALKSLTRNSDGVKKTTKK